LITTLAIAAQAATLSGGITVNGVQGDFTTAGYTFTFTTDSGYTSTIGSVGYNSPADMSYFLSNTLGWTPPTSEAPPLAWGPGDSATVNIVADFGGDTATGTGTVAYPSTSFGIVDLVGATPPIVLLDTGRIRNTNITRVGNDLEISWGFADDIPIDVKIYQYAAVDAEAPTVATEYVFMVDKLAAETSHLIVDGAYDGNSSYFRVVPEFLVDADILADANNSITVGKIEVQSEANGYVFVALPFQEDGISLTNLIGDQLQDAGSLFLWWEGNTYGLSTYSGGNWGTDHSLRLGEGFLMFAPSTKSVALTGRFGTLASAPTQTLLSGYNLIAYPYPRSDSATNVGFSAPETGDMVLGWDKNIQEFYPPTTFSGGDWSDIPSTQLGLGQSKFYYSESGLTWTIVFP
jgi:hypothetical protein